jgi:hypothetical protein
MHTDLSIPAGLCHCGCGKPTRLARRNNRMFGHVKGQPVRYLIGHANRRHDGPDIVARDFWPLVAMSGREECWPWLGTIGGEGYGSFSAAGRRHSAHRLAYELTKGPIAKGQMVCHRCDNPRCCNPAHLFLGTHAANMADMVAKGRGRSPRGEEAPWAKLTEANVREARTLFHKGHPEFGYTGLARRYGVSLTAMHEAINGVKWAHVR